MTKKSKLLDMFETMVKSTIDEQGVYPHVMISIDYKEQINVSALACSPEEAAAEFWKQTGVCEEIVFGLDMTTAPGQGTKYDDALVLAYWKRPDAETNLADLENFTIGVINYQNEPRIVDEIDWDNEHWKVTFPSMLRHFHPGSIIRVQRSNA